MKKIVPEQKISPVKFYFDDGRLKVLSEVNIKNSRDTENIRQALDAIIQQGNALIESLINSNCDKRLLESVTNIRKNLEEDTNIVKTGLMNISCSSISSQFEQELPSAINGMLKGFTASVHLYISQFPAWEQFVENAANTEFDRADVGTILSAADGLAKNLSQLEDHVDDNVPKSILLLRHAIESPEIFSKRAAFALLRTVENLVAKVYQYGAEFLDDTIKSVSKGTSSAISKATIIAILSFTVANAAQLSTVVVKIGEMHWMHEATLMIQRQLDAITR
ncbi:putative PurR-regulated permease PerM [Neorhizobium galegae]|uniref:hypothetical protein n=1 Tax=Neorhizobium galegae TaxID=399 RepID=UPI001AEB40A1|nr:hypothetical protein [Neorhizobium galegae]MBP2549294.1 putative PurR-regulated permease PerM [Neorhizobium galegae]